MEGLKGHVRILESSKADGGALAVQGVEGWDVISVYRVQVTL
ncbi:holin family protein [Salmonella phage 35]|uniref:Holin family protein n=1 Tax=Salmonella phage 35 TaxID=1654888 RepID=A0A0N7CGK4_9CAUD|nr:holin family protein [Salmonella phage 35]AKJ74147.1 holin family protein [Salmonella phage 35]